MPTIAENLQRLVDAKSDIADAITAKGGTVNQGDGFEEFPADIATIPSGGGSVDYTIDVKGTSAVLKPRFKKAESAITYTPSVIESVAWTTNENTLSTLYYNMYSRVWSDGEDIYYSYNQYQYVFNKSTQTWTPKCWQGIDDFTNFEGKFIWSDGENIYLSLYVSKKYNHYVLDRANSRWISKQWDGFSNFTGSSVWSDGENIYISYRENAATTSPTNYQYVLNKATSRWSAKNWGSTNANGITNAWHDGEHTYIQANIYIGTSGGNPRYTYYYYEVINGSLVSITWNNKPSDYLGNTYIWSDGENTYYSSGTTQRVLDSSTLTWNNKTWNGLTSFDGSHIWSDGTNIYCSAGTSNHYILDVSTSTWSQTSLWERTRLTINGEDVWTDGEDIYHSNGSVQYILDKDTGTWSTKTWSGLTSFSGRYIWSDGDDIYYSNDTIQYVLDKATGTWGTKTWSGLTSIYAKYVWSDGENIYYSYSSSQYSTGNYVLNKSTSTWSYKSWSWSPSSLPVSWSETLNPDFIWTDGVNIFCSGADTYGSFHHYVLDKSTSTWIKFDPVKYSITVTEAFSGMSVYTDGINIKMIQSGLSISYLWSDGEHIYYSNGGIQRIYPKASLN